MNSFGLFGHQLERKLAKIMQKMAKNFGKMWLHFAQMVQKLPGLFAMLIVIWSVLCKDVLYNLKKHL